MRGLRLFFEGPTDIKKNIECVHTFQSTWIGLEILRTVPLEPSALLNAVIGNNNLTHASHNFGQRID
jgi:hypothetical protein